MEPHTDHCTAIMALNPSIEPFAFPRTPATAAFATASGEMAANPGGPGLFCFMKGRARDIERTRGKRKE